MTVSRRDPAYQEGTRIHEAREECRRIIEAAKGDKRLGNQTEREDLYDKARYGTVSKVERGEL